MQLLGSLKKDIDKNKDGELVPRLETVEVVWSINYYYTSFTNNAENK